MQRSAVCLAVTLLSSAAAAMELEDGTFLFDAATPVPPAVMALQDCGANDRTFASRRPFADGFLFAIQCPGNNENSVQTLIFAEAEDGTGARLLFFAGPGDRREGFEELVSNVHFYPEKNEIGAIAVDSDPESRPTPSICRTESRWRLEGQPPEPKLVFWRETADCAGATGWKVLVGR